MASGRGANDFYPASEEQTTPEEDLPQQTHLVTGERAKNWPKWPISCFRHYIEEDIIPEEAQNIAKRIYQSWFALILVLCINVAAVAAVIGHETSEIREMFLAVAYLLICPPLGFLIYYVYYTAASKDSDTYFRAFFILFAVQMLVLGLFALGVPTFGAGGFINMIRMFSANVIVAGSLQLVQFFLWISLILLDAYLFSKVWAYTKDKNEVITYTDAEGERVDTEPTMLDHPEDTTPRVESPKTVTRSQEPADIAVQLIKNNKDVIKNTVIDNKEVIAKTVVKNASTIKAVASDHSDDISKIFSPP